MTIRELDEALALVSQATEAVLADPDGMFLGARLIRLQDMLVTAGAVLDPDPALPPLSVAGALERAGTLLDAIPARERPARLLPARVELTGAILAAGGDPAR